MEFTGSKTYNNLLAAFSAESTARTKYNIYSQVCKDAGYEQMAAIFSETAHNEKEHAEIWFKQIYENSIPGVLQALKDGKQGEHYEWTDMYKSYAQTAKEEGYNQIAALFNLVANVEKEHEKRFEQLISNLENSIVFEKDNVVLWQCRNCGHIHAAQAAPEVCPVCSKPKAYFQVKPENY